jgi:general secretion pathway protein A
MIARPGMGKTTLLFQLLEEFRNSAKTAFLFQTQCDSREFIRFLLAELGIETKEQDRVKMHEEFNAVLLREMKAGKRFVVVIDEAQNLDDSVLETVRLLSNFETPRAKLMQIILSGQPELADKLARPNLSQLRQRVSIVARLEPLSPQYVHEYIQHRLRLSGYTGPRLFLPDAESAIIERSEGIPRTINNLCFNALSLAYALGRKQIDRSLVEEISGDLELESIASRRAPQFSIPFNSPIFAHHNEWNFESPEPEAKPAPAEPIEPTPAITTAAAADAELNQLIKDLGSKIEQAPVNGNGAKPVAVVTAESLPVTPEVKPIFTPAAAATKPVRPAVAPAPRPTPPVTRATPYVVRTPNKKGPSKLARWAKPVIFGVLAVDIALGAIFVIHQRSGAESNQKPAAASVLGIPESSPEDGALVTDEADRARGGVGMRVSVPARTMQDNVIRMVPPSQPAGTQFDSDKVLLAAMIGRDGSVREVKVIDGDRKLAKAATDAVKQWRYKPYLVNGQPVDVETQITVSFNSAENRPTR